MKKKLIFLFFTVFLLIANINAIFAANTSKGWFKLQDLNLWIYVKDNGEFARGEWLWIEKEDQPGVVKHYYFNTDGFLVCHGTTPDGKKVNAFGEEVEDGNTNQVIYKTKDEKLSPNVTSNNDKVIIQSKNTKEDLSPDVESNNNGIIIQSKKATEEKLMPPVEKKENKESAQQIINASEYKITSSDYSLETIKNSFLSMFMTYKQKIDNRTITFSKIFQSELKLEDFYNGKSNQLLELDNAELKRLYDEGAQKLSELVITFGNNTAAVSECSKYKNILNSTYITACRNIKNSLDIVANQMINSK